MFLPSFDVSDPLKLLPTADRSRDKIIQMPFTRVFVILHQQRTTKHRFMNFKGDFRCSVKCFSKIVIAFSASMALD